jgi:CHAD domain-containing protein
MPDPELRLAVHGAFTLPDLTADSSIAEVRPGEPVDLWARYWDTADLRLARHGVTLRHRSGGTGSPTWSLQLPISDPPDAGANGIGPRGEIEFDGTGDRIPAGAADLVTAYVRTAPLVEIAALKTRRRRWSLVNDEGSLAAILVDDEVSVVDDGAPISRFRELELEPRRLGAADVARIGDRLRIGGAVDAEPIPLAIRALGPAATAPADAVAPSVGPDASAGAIVRAALIDAVERILRHDAGMRLGDTEALHQARVGIRMLRSHLRTFAPLLDARWTVATMSELDPIVGILGRVRDLDVLATRLRRDGGDLLPLLDPLFDDVAARRDAAQRELLDRLRDERYASLLERLVAAASAPRLITVAAQPAREVLPPLFMDAWRRLRRRADALGQRSPGSEYHAARISLKRARYCAVAIAPGLEPDDRVAAEKLGRRLARLQSMLGAAQDAAMARSEIMAGAARHLGDGPFNLAAGVLLERETRRGMDAQAAFRERWPRVRRRRNRRWTRR